MEDKVLTTTETAKLLGISVRTAQLLIESGGLPSWKTPGGHRRVHRSDVEAFMEQTRAHEKSRSALVYVVTTPERQPVLQPLFDAIGHVVTHFFPNTWLAAVAAGAHAPALAVVDLDGWKEEGVQLLQTFAADSRFKNTRLVAVTAVAEGRVASLPARVHQATPRTLAETVNLLTSDPPELIRQVLQGDFPIAANEASRLQAVQRSGLVHTPAEEQFDRVTWLAAWGLESPIALMTVLTPDLQWFKSRQGLDMEETPRSWAFCNYAVLQKGVFEVPDLAEHPVFSQNPAVANAPHFRFYAGAPVYDADGFALGSICIIDFHPRQLDQNQRRTLLELAAIASDEVRLREASARG
ncbi:helix-turn-helix domain-containing protein [Bordetella sp. 2513F-2]